MAFIRLAKISEVREGEVLSVETDIGSVGLTRIGEEILAFQNLCTHDDGPLDGGKLDGETISCPRHGACFNIRDGAVLRMPATEAIETYKVRVTGEDVEADLD